MQGKIQNSTRITLVIDKALLGKLDALAKQRELTRSDLLREAARRMVGESEKGGKGDV